MNPPIAKKIRTTFENHGDIRHDDYYWLNEKTNQEVLAYLEAENAYFADVMAPLNALTNDIYESMIARIPNEEIDVPIQRGPYFYYTRQEKDLQYPIYARKLAATRAALAEAKEEIILDVNVLAAGDDYLSTTDIRPTDDQRLLAYLENRDGTDSYTLYIKDLQTGALLDDVIPNVYISSSVEWSACGHYLFYVTINDQQRPYQLWRHKLGTAITEDVLLYEEQDVTFNLYVAKSQSSAYIFVIAQATTTTEIRYIDATMPLEPLTLFDARQTGIEYDVEHWEHDFILMTNKDAINFKLLRCPVENIAERSELVPYDETYFIESIYPFKQQIYISGRANGLEQIFRIENNELIPLEWDEPIYSVSLAANQDYNADEVLVHYQSFVTPKTTFGIGLVNGEKSKIQQVEVTGDYDAKNYVQQQLWATAPDGVKVPVLLQYQKDAFANGPAPVILTAYGSYGYSSDPFFSAYRLPLLDKGIVFATAQVRGGSELGRTWYFDGKMKHKRNTFTDFIAAADLLVQQNITTNELLIGRGGSAGGLLIGAVANMAGEKFKVLVPEVPFVDVLTTMLDDTIPLTTSEYDEWGNPNKAEDYFTMRAYSPYENVEAKAYPHMYVTTGLNDPRVGYWEPAKWVARLRELKTDDNTLVMKTNMGAGHFGASGRFNQLKELAEFYAFVLNKVGVQ